MRIFDVYQALYYLIWTVIAVVVALTANYIYRKNK
jgi:hypothetical protein